MQELSESTGQGITNGHLVWLREATHCNSKDSDLSNSILAHRVSLGHLSQADWH